MELLYVWINESKHEIFKQQGINLSPEFNFNVEKQEEQWVLLEDLSWESKKSIFKDNIIENVSAIVGRNGIGKTTLLDYLARLDCLTLHKASYNKGYDLMKERDIRKSLCIYVFKENEKISIYHNFETGFINKTEYDDKNMSDGELYRKTLLEETDFKDIFRIYITNSNYGSIQKDGISRQMKLDEVALTPKGISTIAASYFNKILDLDVAMYNPTLYREWREKLKSWLKPEQFQQVCDILYFNKLIKENKMEEYAVHVSTQLSVACASALAILQRKYPQKLQPKEELKLSGVCEFIGKLQQKIDQKLNIVIKNLILNLILEICLDSEIDYPENITSMSECLEWVENNVNVTSNEDYFKEAIAEIEELAVILERASEKDNVVPKGDLAYDSSLVFDYKKDLEGYKKFANFIEKCFSSKYSMVMRYLMIGNIGMSSGERAFQNFFSWMNLLPQFHSIDPSVPETMRDTILLLIDEIDLYLHPEWQKNLISFLLDEVRNQFSGYKVQIIFTTHSPLCLSDVPRENTVYLSGKSGNVIIDDRKKHEQTFGKDLYSLLNDAFYLEDNTMGLYAKKYIDNIIEQIIDKNNNEYKKHSWNEIEILKQKIQCIGNELLKNKLLSMIQNCFLDNEDELEMLYKQHDMIERRIAELEA